MTDWPSTYSLLPGGVISSVSTVSGFGQTLVAGNMTAAALWPVANKALYVPFYLEVPLTIYQVGLIVGAQAGNLDVGIYDELGNRVVSKGSTAVGAAGVQLVDITDTPLTPGTYFMAMCCSDATTASFNRISLPDAQTSRTAGIQEQAVGAVTLPNPATFANPAAAYVPLLSLATKATI